MSSSPVTDSRKRPRGSGFSADSLLPDFCDGVYTKRRGPQIIQQKVSPSSSSSSRVHPASVAFFTGKEDIGSSYSRSHESLAPVSSSASALTDTADSCTLAFSLPHEYTDSSTALRVSLPYECACGGQQLLCCASSDEEAESCCGVNETSKLDIDGFLVHEVWDDAGSEGGDAFAFNPETVFLNNGGPSTDCSEDVAFAGCSAENGNWFLNDLEGEGHGYLNEVLDQEWMAAAVANLDRINDTLDADLCVLHLFESEHADGA